MSVRGSERRCSVIPTREEYEKALNNREFASTVLKKEYRCREALIEQLCDSQRCIQSYVKIVDDAEEVITRYEIYQEVQNG